MRFDERDSATPTSIKRNTNATPKALYILPLLLGALVQWQCKSDVKYEKALQQSSPTAQTEQAPPEITDTSHWMYHLQQAETYFQNHQHGLAELHLKRALRKNPNAPQIYLALAEVYLDWPKSRKAIEVLEEAVQKFPRDTALRLQQIYVLLVLRQYATALKKSSELLRLDPQNARNYFFRGMIFKETGHDSLALVNFQRAVEFDPEFIDAYINIGEIYTRKKDPIALQYFNNVLDIDPDNPLALHSIAYFHQVTGHPDRAIEILEDLIKKQGKYYDAYLSLGLLYLDKEDYRKAFEKLSILLSINDQYLDAYYYRAVAAEALGLKEQAIKDLETLLSFAPDYPNARELLQSLQKEK